MPVKLFSVLESPSAADFNRYFMQQIYVQKTADESYTSVTLQDDNHLFFDSVAGADYWITMFVIYDADTTTDIKSNFTMPADAIFWYVSDAVWSGAGSSVDQVSRTAQFAPGGGSPGGGGNGVGNNVGMLFKGVLRFGVTPGRFQYQWALNTSGAFTTRVRARSVLIARRLTN